MQQLWWLPRPRYRNNGGWFTKLDDTHLNGRSHRCCGSPSIHANSIQQNFGSFYFRTGHEQQNDAEVRTTSQHLFSSSVLERALVCLLVGCLTSQQQASVSQGRICSDNFTCCHTEIDVADQTFYLTQSQYTDTRPTSPSADPITPGAWQGSHWCANF